ncbi:hypothetical protein COPEUT_02636 [Coprococcus eutactus ATCC 27759]|nr:hypothetical protein COPEUT_02636 [Coprococcus eutactus ATCC 27759]
MKVILYSLLMYMDILMQIMLLQSMKSTLKNFVDFS